MRIFKYSHLFVCAVVIAIGSLHLSASGTTFYVAQSAGTFSGGTACNGQAAESIATFNAGTEAAGNTYYFCGTITTTVNIHGSGNSSSPITFKWDTGSRISQPVAQAINLNGSSSFLLFDGGTPCGPGTSCDTAEQANMTGYVSGQTGIIEATANGSGLANQSFTSQAFINCNGCHDIEIRNLIIRNLYQHTSMTDTTMSIDAYAFTFECLIGSGCGTGPISIHDSTIHDNGNAIDLDRTVDSTINIYNNDFYRNNWAIGNSGNGTRTVNIHDNHIHDASNWDTSNDFFHHNGLHNFMNVATDSLALNFYNNLIDGNWGNCCTTATSLFTEVDSPNNFNVFNNVTIQYPGNLAPAYDYQATGGVFANNTSIGVATTPSNTNAVQIYAATTGVAFENNVIQGYGQYLYIQAGASFTTFDYNTYGPKGESGTNAWQTGSSGSSSFSGWQKVCSCDSHGQYNASLNVSSLGAPASGSVVLGAGTNLTDLQITALNSATSAGDTLSLVTRPASGAWAAGAYQLGGSGPNPPVGVTSSAAVAGSN